MKTNSNSTRKSNESLLTQKIDVYVSRIIAEVESREAAVYDDEPFYAGSEYDIIGYYTGSLMTGCKGMSVID